MESKPTLYTKQGTDEAIARAVAPLATREELSGYATKDEVATAAAGGKVELTGYATKDELQGLATREELSGYATARQVADLATRADLTAYATKDEIVGVARASDLTGLATKDELSGYATKSDVAGIAHASDLTGLATKAELQAALTGVGITVVSTEAEAQRLPDGALYFLAAAASPAQPPTPPPGPAPAAGPAVVAHASGSVVGQTITVNLGGEDGDKIILGINEKAQGGRATAALPQGWKTLVDPYWVGTMSATVVTGPWAPTITITMSQNAEIGWAAATVRGASRIEAGTVKKRQAEPVETKTCTAPALAGAGLALGFAFERTSAGESSEQVTVSEGWEKLEFVAQEGANYQTVTLAKRTAASPADLVVTYPNVQGSNGLGVQVVARG
jgi:hypothetical protein